MNQSRQPLGLQIAVALAGLVPVGAGLAGVLAGPALVGDSSNPDLDSHFRYLSGLLLGIGLLFWAIIPGIAQRTTAFRLLTAIVVVGGLGRPYGMLVAGVPPAPMVAALGAELVATPLLCLWQARIARD
jgi:hypothetical protein